MCIIMAKLNFYLYSQILIVNAVLQSFKGSICYIFKTSLHHQRLGNNCQWLINETMVEMIDNLCLTQVVF